MKKGRITCEEEISGCICMIIKKKLTGWSNSKKPASLIFVLFSSLDCTVCNSLGSQGEIPRRLRLPLCHCYTAPVLHVTPEMLQLTLHTPQTNTQPQGQAYHKSHTKRILKTTAAGIPCDTKSQDLFNRGTSLSSFSNKIKHKDIKV